MWWSALALSVLTTAGGVRFETDPCAASLPEVVGLLGVKLPTEEGWLVRLETGWSLTVQRPDGSPALQRQFAPQTDCREAVQASALVLERLFRALPSANRGRFKTAASIDGGADAGTGAAAATSQTLASDPTPPLSARPSIEPAQDPSSLKSTSSVSREPTSTITNTTETRTKALAANAPTEPSASPSSADGVVTSASAAHNEPNAPTESPEPRVTSASSDALIAVTANQTPASAPSAVTAVRLSVLPVLFIGTTRGAFGGGSVLAQLELWRVWQLGLRFGLVSPSLESVIINQEVRGSITAVPLWAAAQAQRCTETTLRLCGGLDLGARLIVATASGDRLYRTGQSLVAAPTLGLALGADVAVWRGLTLGLHTVAAFPLAPSSFTLEGAPDIDFGNLLEVSVGVSVGWAWGPKTQ